MDIKLSRGGWKRHFSVPCSLFDNYIKDADEASLKVILCMYASDEDILSINDILHKTGLTSEQIQKATQYWMHQGVICSADTAVANIGNDSSVNITVSKTKPVTKREINLGEYAKNHAEYKELIKEAEVTLGRTLKEYEKKILVDLTDYYGFTAPSVILILEHCAKSEHISAKYIETVAANMYEKGIVTYNQLEDEFTRLDEYYSYEAQIKRILGIDVKLTKKQSSIITAWKDKGFSTDMISLAREKCVDATNKLSLPYMDKIIANWEAKGIFTLEAAEGEEKRSTAEPKEKSFDLGEYDDFSLGDYIKK